MASTSHRRQEAVGSGEAHRLDDVRYTGAASDERRVPVDRSVPDPAELFVGWVSGSDKLAAEAARNASTAPASIGTAGPDGLFEAVMGQSIYQSLRPECGSA